MKDTTTRPDWSKNVLGTHYVRSITYGGDLIARISIDDSDARQIEKIEAELKAELNGLGAVDAGAKAQFKKLERDLKSSSQMKISYFSTTLHGAMPRDIEGMLETLDSFKDQVMKSNEGKGVPLSCELLPLSVLDPKLPQVLKDTSLTVQLGDLEDKYDDVVQAKATLDHLVTREDVQLDDEQEQKASVLEDHITEILAVFNEVIANLDVTTRGKGATRMESAFQVYKKHKKIGGYKRQVTQFVRAVLPKPQVGNSIIGN